MPNILAQFQLAPDGDLYRLQFVLEDGQTIQVLASFEQLDLLSEEIDRQLDSDEDGDSEQQ
jgi:hypothetical protein